MRKDSWVCGAPLSVLLFSLMASGTAFAQTPAEPALSAVTSACTLSMAIFAFGDDKARRPCTRNSDCSRGYRCGQDGRCERRPNGRPPRPPARPPCNRGTFIPECQAETGGNLRTRQDDCRTAFYEARGPDGEDLLNDVAACRRMRNPLQVGVCLAAVAAKFGWSIVANEVAAQDELDRCYAEADSKYEPEFEECIARGLKTC